MTMTATRPSVAQSKLMKQLEDDDPIIVVSIKMKKSLQKEVKHYVVEKGITIQELTTKAIKEYMRKNA